MVFSQLKRKQGVRGTAGSTPAQPSKVAHRRDSSIFNATPASRPPSALSDAGTDGGSQPSTTRKERKNSSETAQTASAARVSALAKSTRVNGSGFGTPSVTSSATKPLRSEGSMGPPPVSLKPRASVNGTPTPSGRLSSLSRSASARSALTSPTATPIPHRRVSSVATTETPQSRTKISRATVNASPAPSALSEQDEKENTNTPSRQRIPTLA